MTVKSFTFNPFQTNCYVCHDAGEAVIVDAANYTAEEQAGLLAYIDEHALVVKHLLLTHGHVDHVFGCASLAAHFDDAFLMHRDDLPLLDQAGQHAALFGVHIDPPPAPKSFLAEGDVLTFGHSTWDILHTPGHSPGSICFLDREHDVVLGGDVLFHDSIGRTDLWRGSLPELMRSIFEKLMPLDDGIAVYPGHGPATTIGRERHHNPFLQSPVG